MTSWWKFTAEAVVILILIAGIWQFRYPKMAKLGNLTAALALVLALVAVIYRNGVLDPAIVVGVLLVGSVVGSVVAVRVTMIQIPAMVAFQHGAGGVAAFLVSTIELIRSSATLSTVGLVAGILGIMIGAATFSGSMIASAKLADRMASRPTIFPRHNLLLIGLVALAAVIGTMLVQAEGGGLIACTLGAILVGAVFGIVFAIRIGGADMPVLISLLNATAGLAAALCGVIIQNGLLIAFGAVVAASGSILTHVMCKAMNRNLVRVFAGLAPPVAAPDGAKETMGADAGSTAPPVSEGTGGRDSFTSAIEAVKDAKSVIIVPGLGMAQAQAQFEVVALGEKLEKMGADVRFAVHPVAGRMPGHMHVLLGEAEVDYSKISDLKDINGDFAHTDLALVVGACDVVNPAATIVEGTPISGMQILNAHEAGKVIVCNLDEHPGYSGVPNMLYDRANAILLFDDAKVTLSHMIQAID
jgi:H+-translocating NAD(P) transhydrogenase subunit beta